MIPCRPKYVGIFNGILCLCLWFRASLIYINNCPTRCNTKQSFYYSAIALYMFRVSAIHIIRSTQKCNYSLRYWSYFLCSYLPPTWPRLATLEGGSCTVPEAVVTVLCTPDDGYGWNSKHVEWTCRIINRLLCVESRWTVINVYSVGYFNMKNILRNNLVHFVGWQLRIVCPQCTEWTVYGVPPPTKSLFTSLPSPLLRVIGGLQCGGGGWQ